MRCFYAALFALSTAEIASAAPFNYVDAPAGGVAIPDSSCGIATTVTRTFNVTDSFSVNDLNFGFIANHPYKDPLEVTIISPSNTSVVVINSTSTNQNYNVQVDSASGTSLNDGLNHNTSIAPYEHTRAPTNSLNTFNGEIATGLWTVEICDSDGFNDNGTYLRSELIFDGTATSGSDLSMDITPSSTTPDTGSTVTINYQIDNAGPETTDGVSATLSLGSGLTYLSDDGGGSYNSGTGIWTVPGTIVNGSNATLQITAIVNSSGSFVTSADVTTSNKSDTDSTPGNNNTVEDDYDSVTLSPVTPVIPPLFCAAGVPSRLDWASQTWTAGSLTHAPFVVDGTTINFSLTDVNSWMVANPVAGGQTPQISTTLTGGFTPAESNLLVVADPTNQTNITTATITLGDAGVGVSKFQMTLFDIDFGASQFEDFVTVTGSLNGSPVATTLTAGTANTVNSGAGTATGTGTSNTNSSNGNMTIEFASSVDTVTVSYRAGANSPADPGTLGVGFHDILFCPPPLSPDLQAAKSIEVYDPTNIGLYALPGNDVIYTITVSNAGDGAADADSIELIDILPSEIEFWNGDIDDGGPESFPVAFVQPVGSGMSLTYGTDVRFGTGATPPANYAACSVIAPDNSYRPDLTYICLNPKGTLAAGDPDPAIALSFRTRIK